MHEVLVNRLGGLSLPRKSVVRLTDRTDMTLDVYRGRKTTIQQYLSTLGYIQTSESHYIFATLLQTLRKQVLGSSIGIVSQLFLFFFSDGFLVFEGSYTLFKYF